MYVKEIQHIVMELNSGEASTIAFAIKGNVMQTAQSHWAYHYWNNGKNQTPEGFAAYVRQKEDAELNLAEQFFRVSAHLTPEIDCELREVWKKYVKEHPLPDK